MIIKALIEFSDVIQVWVEMRPPKRGELAWTVPAEATPAEALDHVVCGRDVWSAGEAGFGYRATCDGAELDFLTEVGMRNIVVHVEHVRTEPRLDNNVIPHIRLL